jgi:hypothetical protein
LLGLAGQHDGVGAGEQRFEAGGGGDAGGGGEFGGGIVVAADAGDVGGAGVARINEAADNGGGHASGTDESDFLHTG